MLTLLLACGPAVAPPAAKEESAVVVDTAGDTAVDDSPAPDSPADTGPDDGCADGEVGSYLRYVDDDGDGYGAIGSEFYSCAIFNGARVGEDCDDTDPNVHPNANELCAGPDQDCDGLIGTSEATDARRWYDDLDGDSFGGQEHGPDCEMPAEGIFIGGDCDDGDAAINPGAAEDCDGVDQDCDGAVDVGADGPNLYCYDGDKDGYGDLGQPWMGCVPSGYWIEDCTDCDDTEKTVHPGSGEVSCVPGGDANCDGVQDDHDGDGDGFTACEDCHDLDPAIHPGAADACGDGIDGDCDGVDLECEPAGPGIFGDYDGVDRLPVGTVIAVADVDGDGRDDALVGSPEAVWGSSQGGAFLWSGPLRRDEAPSTLDLEWSDATACFSCGTAVLPFDFDGDGVMSLAIGDNESTVDATKQGAVMLLVDATVDTLSSRSLLVLGDGANDQLGEVLARGPDLDGDGADDLYLGASDAAAGGQVLGVATSSTGVLYAADLPLVVQAETNTDELGVSVVALDEDGDGSEDLVATAPARDGGCVYLLRGPVSGSLSAADADQFVDGTGTELGSALADAGDLDGDGRDDLFVSDAAEGRVWLLSGGSWPSTDADATWGVTGGTQAPALGASIALIDDSLAAGDIGPAPGVVWIFSAPWTGAVTTTDATTSSSGADDGYGSSLGVGDLDGDGLPDLLVGEPGYPTYGVAWLWSNPA